ncbi:SKN-1 Dependent Zygotic transcript [Caenorhabditis elegans]|uniref:SKN-1 Dependent Zygotic transcript n=1 Tax=Caenorhabditis elegans TaxID=6239 RepID=O18299_CAEEL|nr:SKN-1 Dependent Zygotic transcript [Caenorhabditis elegans]CAA88484.1 SKN-1 Dependent Zygotic transcript [Caenorhabditis elegans]|eukprot:NP_496250.1 SKN-1 Dependent Zygotic transcript [Caenorhabditis elegans]
MEYSQIPSFAFYNNASIFQFFPRNKRLNTHQKSCLDEHARKMAVFMMERQEEYRYYENLANQEQFSDDACFSDTGMDSGFCSGATSTGQSASTSPAPAHLIPNPFFDPEYVAKAQSPVKLVANPFYNPELVKEIKKKSRVSV